MIRWPMAVIGLLLIATSIAMRVKFSPLLEVPEALSIEQAQALLSGDERHYVAIGVPVDRAKRIYFSATRHPPYTGRDTSKRYSLLDKNGELVADPASYLGCVVKLNRPLEGPCVSLKLVREKTLAKDEVTGERLLAPLRGTHDRIWALSKTFRRDEAGKRGWLSQGVREGPLIRLREINKNLSSSALRHEWKEIRKFIRKEFQRPPPDNAYLILTEYTWDFHPRWFAPLAGSEALFVRLDEKAEAKMQGKVTGILKPSASRFHKDFPGILGRKLPPRIGIITLESGAAYNRRHAANAADTALVGGVLFTLGLLGILWRRSRAKKKPAAHEVAPEPRSEPGPGA